MARIAGVNIPQNKLVHVGLTYIFGIGDKFSDQICNALEIEKSTRVNQLNDDQILKIRTRCNARTRKGKAIAIAGKKLTPLKK